MSRDDQVPSSHPEMTAGEASDLANLTFHWSEAYAISLDGETWRAVFHGPGAIDLTAGTADGLRDLIRSDYAARQRAAGDCAGRTGMGFDEFPTAPIADLSDG